MKKTFWIFLFLIATQALANNEYFASCIQQCSDHYNASVEANDKNYDFDESGKLIDKNNEGKLREMQMMKIAREFQECQKNCNP